MKTDNYTLDVTKCLRCNKNHKALVFKPFKQSVTQYTHWALCPVTKEPMLTGYATLGDLPQLKKLKGEGRSFTLSAKQRKAFCPVFLKGQKAKTLDGKKITIVKEKRDPEHHYDTVLGSDGIWRYDRPNDCGRTTGQLDPKCPHNLVYGAMGS